MPLHVWHQGKAGEVMVIIIIILQADLIMVAVTVLSIATILLAAATLLVAYLEDKIQVVAALSVVVQAVVIHLVVVVEVEASILPGVDIALAQGNKSSST